jgi:quinol---cytochrome c reductase iron-sulfur subunit, bacillus type
VGRAPEASAFYFHGKVHLSATPNDSTKEPDAGSPLGRRRFLQRVSGIGAAISAAMVGIPVLRALGSPALIHKTNDAWIKVADDIALLDVGVPVRVNFVQTLQDAWVETRALNGVWLYTEDGEKFKAYNGHCTHLGCSYVYDKARQNFFCPCHHGQFDVKTGSVLAGPPPRPLDELPVEIRDSAVFVQYTDYRLGVSDKIEA